MKPDETTGKACFPSHTVHHALAWKPPSVLCRVGRKEVQAEVVGVAYGPLLRRKGRTVQGS